MFYLGSVLSSKAQSDAQLHKARIEARRIIHALHKAQDKVEVLEVSVQKNNIDIYIINHGLFVFLQKEKEAMNKAGNSGGQ